ncbi:hypothetical protein [Rhodococcus sp. AG1013]|uniref:hypothetical protein n=1 Tax=unclassified Rhodococcus (in: high G+C Gram-positive bacteria) TaxID=192944 RepID=UPI000E0C2F86|nr:hypothetical protein [Rhodococcus sp. AG1013]RDI20544.1 hypothetical protein DEU38_11693 [Rhodococcus sp. AG1013]
MPDAGMLERYQAFRTRRFLRNEEQFKNWLPSWRTQRRRRALVALLAVIFVCMLAVGVVCLTNMRIGPLLWLPAGALFITVWTTLQIVSGRQGDAPRDALDEWEIAQRDSARSIGLTVTQVLTFVPAMFLIIGGALDLGIDRPNFIYASGLFVLTTLIIGACVPAMILAWTRPDPDPDDHLEPE